MKQKKHKSYKQKFREYHKGDMWENFLSWLSQKSKKEDIGDCSYEKCTRPAKRKNVLYSRKGNRKFYYCNEHYNWCRKIRDPVFNHELKKTRNRKYARLQRLKNKEKINKRTMESYHKNKHKYLPKRKKKYYQNHEETLIYHRKNKAKRRT